MGRGTFLVGTAASGRVVLSSRVINHQLTSPSPQIIIPLLTCRVAEVRQTCIVHHAPLRSLTRPSQSPVRTSSGNYRRSPVGCYHDLHSVSYSSNSSKHQTIHICVPAKYRSFIPLSFPQSIKKRSENAPPSCRSPLALSALAAFSHNVTHLNSRHFCLG